MAPDNKSISSLLQFAYEQSKGSMAGELLQVQIKELGAKLEGAEKQAYEQVRPRRGIRARGQPGHHPHVSDDRRHRASRRAAWRAMRAETACRKEQPERNLLEPPAKRMTIRARAYATIWANERKKDWRGQSGDRRQATRSGSVGEVDRWARARRQGIPQSRRP